MIDDPGYEANETVVFALQLVGDPDVEILTPNITFIIIDNDGNHKHAIVLFERNSVAKQIFMEFFNGHIVKKNTSVVKNVNSPFQNTGCIKM